MIAGNYYIIWKNYLNGLVGRGDAIFSREQAIEYAKIENAKCAHVQYWPKHKLAPIEDVMKSTSK
jgi:hypothetical protein